MKKLKIWYKELIILLKSAKFYSPDFVVTEEDSVDMLQLEDHKC